MATGNGNGNLMATGYKQITEMSRLASILVFHVAIVSFWPKSPVLAKVGFLNKA